MASGWYSPGPGQSSSSGCIRPGAGQGMATSCDDPENLLEAPNDQLPCCRVREAGETQPDLVGSSPAANIVLPNSRSLLPERQALPALFPPHQR
eukprot:754981-Hanusia_phi.AAC.3